MPDPAERQRPLRLHIPPVRTDRHWWPTFLEPLSSELAQPGPSDYQRQIAGRWLDEGRSLLRLSDPTEADVSVLPFGLEATVPTPALENEARRWASEAAAHGLPMLVFCQGDVEVRSPGPNCLTFRTSSSTRTLNAHDIPLPAWIADPSHSTEIGRSAWSSPPTVNFVGQAYPLGAEFTSRAKASAKWIKAAIRAMATSLGAADRLGMPRYHAQRAAAVQALRMSRQVKARVVLRPAPTRLDMNRATDRALHLELLSAIVGSDYTLAPRGYGNYSFRLYESLACGRPAILVESGMPLPCATECPWHEIVLTLSTPQLLRLGVHVSRRHDLVRQRWSAIQELCRSSWETYLSAHGFFSRLARKLTTHRASGAVDLDALVASLR